MAITLKDKKKKGNSGPVEKVLSGRSVSKGFALGEAVCLYGVKRQFYRIKLKNNEVEREVKRFHAAVRLALRRLKKISAPAGDFSTGILDVQFLLLEDQSLIDKVEYLIRTQKVNAEWAVKEVSDKYLEAYKAIQDDYLKERYIDLEDVTERLMGALDGGAQNSLSFSAGTIVVAKEIMPSTMVEILNSDVRGIVTESGGWTSHSFILAREHGLPSITGVKNVLQQVSNGIILAVDGDRGAVTIDPLIKKPLTASVNTASTGNAKTAPVTPRGFYTLDGKKIVVKVNCDTVAHYLEAKQLGAKGVGLFRSEFLVNRERGFPSEKTQLREYAEIAKQVGADGVSIRTFDIDASLTLLGDEREKNPALGLRAIRLGLANEKIFRTQVRALLRAAYKRHLKIVLPMISDITEIRQAKKIIAEEKKALTAKGIKTGRPKIGVMIEVPSAVLMAPEIAAEVDFLSLGTNDLVQYLLAVDRDNENVADWFRTLHPAVLRSVKHVLDAGKKHETPVVVCGEMSGSPVYSVILIGLGATELSMSVKALPRVMEIITGISAKDAARLTKNLLKSSSADEAEGLVRREFVRKWSNLFDLQVLPQAAARKPRKR
jgi:phosphoenolpyruvate-protein phosphotransferase (PTS system enzyme I)